MTLYSASIDPMYARMMGSWYDETTTNSFKRLGGGTYGYVGALLGIFPILIYYWRRNDLVNYSKRTVLMALVFLYFVLITMQFFGNILISTMFIILSFMSARKLKRTAVLLAVLFFTGIIIPKENYTYLLKSTATFFPIDSENYSKIIDLAMYIETGESGKDKKGGMAENRAARAPELLETFLNNPIVGAASNNSSTYDQAGAHLYWMNRLAIFGIVGFGMSILFHRFYLINQEKKFDESFAIYFLLASFSILSYGLIKNLGGREVWYMYFVIIPGAYYLPLLNKKT